jgi:hypothetical protein
LHPSDWQVVDAVPEPAPDTDFYALLDRGCLHFIPERYWPVLARSARASAQTGTHFLLLLTTAHAAEVGNDPARQAAELRARVERAFASLYTIDRVEEAVMQVLFDDRLHVLPGLAFWMTAR